jgi:hypothetical protein
MIKSIFKSVIIIISFLFSIQLASAQNEDKTVTITVSGSGKNQEEAKQSALRSSIEQAFGAFISSKTEILNDQVVAEQMASVSSGNIKSFSILNESQLPDGRWGVTLKALVSVDKLTSFVEAKGIAIEIKGSMFALNIKQQSLNELGEVKAVSEMVGLLHEPMQISFDYVLKSSEPKSLDAYNKNWEIPLMVTATANKNMDFCANYCIKTLTALSLSSEEAASYRRLNKAVFSVNINYNRVTKTFYLRKQGSINALNTFTRQWEFYTRSFTVKSGMDESYGNGEGQIHNFSNYDYDDNKGKVINFLTAGQQSAIFSLHDKRTLSDIEQMTGYKVQPRGVVSRFKHGGFVVYEKDGHGLVLAITDLGKLDWNSAKSSCAAMVINGYSDWHLPTKEELDALYLNLIKPGIISFTVQYEDYYYWSSTEHKTESEYTDGIAWVQRISDGRLDLMGKNRTFYVRAVRTF